MIAALTALRQSESGETTGEDLPANAVFREPMARSTKRNTVNNVGLVPPPAVESLMLRKPIIVLSKEFPSSMVDMLLAVIPAALAGSAILAFFWTLVMRINELESRTTATRSMQESMEESIHQSIQQETRSGVEAVRTAMLKRITSIEDARQEDATRLADLTRNLEENATRQSRAVESMASMLSTLHVQMTEQEERMTALMDLRLTTAAQETTDDLRRLEFALAGSGARKESAAVAASA